MRKLVEKMRNLFNKKEEKREEVHKITIELEKEIYVKRVYGDAHYIYLMKDDGGVVSVRYNGPQNKALARNIITIGQLRQTNFSLKLDETRPVLLMIGTMHRGNYSVVGGRLYVKYKRGA